MRSVLRFGDDAKKFSSETSCGCFRNNRYIHPYSVSLYRPEICRCPSFQNRSTALQSDYLHIRKMFKNSNDHSAADYATKRERKWLTKKNKVELQKNQDTREPGMSFKYTNRLVR